MTFPEHIFRSYDIRGKLDEVTEEIAYQVGAAMVVKKGARTLIVGRDMRETSPALKAAVIRGITEMGARVIDIGECTTSLFNFAVSSTPEVDLGVMVTASHNPADYNGLKVSQATSQPISGKELLELVREEFPPAETVGTVREEQVVDRYLEKALSLVDLPDLTGTKVVVDYGNGMGIVTVRPLLERLGVSVTELYPNPDARFPNHEANPAVEENLVDLQAAVKAQGADMGIALDGDVDRMKIIDENGVSVATDVSHAFLMHDVLTQAGGGKAVVTMNMSWATHDAVKRAGGEVVECMVGRTHVIRKMLEVGAEIGGEVSGHIMFKDFACLESIDYAIVRSLALWKTSGKKMSEIAAEFQTYANSGEVNREVEDKEAVLAAVENAFASEASDVNKEDGIRCVFEKEWWFILRKSNTEPVVRLTVEARTKELMEEKREEILSVMESLA
jgi:phosphomannomutase